MNEVITYNLRDISGDSSEYYLKINKFTYEVMDYANPLVKDYVEDFIAYIIENKIENLRTSEEYTYEILMMGVLWQQYVDQSLRLPAIPQKLLSLISEKRNNSGIFKPLLNSIKGLLVTMFLDNRGYTSLEPQYTIGNLHKLIKWLDAAGDYRQEVLRLYNWYNFIRQLPPERVEKLLVKSNKLANWFNKRSLEALGEYTTNIRSYISNIRPKHKWKEDYLFCGRKRIEYHLNMVGAEIMNKAFEEDFKSKKKKTLLLPACMRLLPEGECKAEKANPGFRCTLCSRGCNVGKLTGMGKVRGFDVLIIPHESTLSPDDEEKTDINRGTGVVGVSCIASLVSGGWMLKELGISAQCVLLDYCGCKSHWHDEGIKTEINTRKLEEIMKLPNKEVSLISKK